MTRIHDKKLNKVSECNVLHDMINPPKRANNLNSHYYPIIHGFMNTRKSIVIFKDFLILLDSGCISRILIGRLVKTLKLEKYAVTQLHTQAGNIITNLKVKLYFTLPTLISMYIMAWKFHVDDSTKGG